MPRFVVLRHELPATSARQSHWDLMLEDHDRLLTWALPQLHVNGCQVDAKSLADHRLVYLEYEGPVANDRGHVRQWDSGQFEWITRDERRIEIHVAGHRLHGTIVLAEEDQGWRFTFKPSSTSRQGS